MRCACVSGQGYNHFCQQDVTHNVDQHPGTEEVVPLGGIQWNAQGKNTTHVKTHPKPLPASFLACGVDHWEECVVVCASVPGPCFPFHALEVLLPREDPWLNSEFKQ